ncbi:latent-transforming growth factor beta-binding protein 1-like [Scyliorhinus canicula]|uniref:latent-transforming growth factor beta-binding protein 1-like n=1 Tax=Scyliorhinus canicula TaxID=7830 RepID=UPI0018F781A2|nr:latent-transforming growth factor beta-binding protein 1-like [Scyliorhinus canicula]
MQRVTCTHCQLVFSVTRSSQFPSQHNLNPDMAIRAECQMDSAQLSMMPSRHYQTKVNVGKTTENAQWLESYRHRENMVMAVVENHHNSPKHTTAGVPQRRILGLSCLIENISFCNIRSEFTKSSECTGPADVSPGNRCSPGFFCPEGSSLPQICAAGYYCDQYELAEPTGPCDTGYYCPTGSVERAPDPFTCIAGHYCPEGSPSPKPCPEGTYSSTPRNKAHENCLQCTPGFFCEGIGLLHTTGPCLSGYYCPEGQSSPTTADFLCPAGSRCPAGSPSPDPCPKGFYQARKGQPDCNACPAGSYCYTPELENWGVEAPQRCPPGHFCPPRTEFATQYKCPRGTFSNKEGLTSAAECDLCPPGQFCSQEGLVKSSGSCFPGFYCLRGAMYPNPNDGITGDICPMGKYCEAGSTAGVDCPVGRYGNKTGLASLDDCTLCDPGFYCGHPGLTAPQGPCAAGYYCKLGN